MCSSDQVFNGSVSLFLFGAMLAGMMSFSFNSSPRLDLGIFCVDL